MNQSPEMFGLLDLSDVPIPPEPKPSKVAGAAGKNVKDKPGRGRGAGHRGGPNGPRDKKRAGKVGGPGQGGSRQGKAQGGQREADFCSTPKQKLNTVEEEAKRRRMEFDGYKAEARIRCTAGDHDKAIEMYTKALEIEKKDRMCLVARATCHFQVGNFEQAVGDADKAIQVDRRCAQAIHVKGEALYQKGEFEMALVCYFRAKSIRPGVPEYDRGIQKAQGAIENCIGELSNTKLVHPSDLGDFESQMKREDKCTELLIHRGSRATSQVGGRQGGSGGDGDGRHRVSTSKKKANTMKQMLGELYGDWQYLENILGDEEHLLDNMKEEEATEEQRRRRLIREKRESLSLKTNNSAVDDDDDKLIPRDTFTADIKKKKQELSESVRDMCRDELQYLDERSEFWRQQKSPQLSRKEEVGTERRRSSILSSSMSGHTTPASILNMLEEIEEDQSVGKHAESLRKAEHILKKLKKSQESEGRPELLGTVYSLMGNAHLELEHYGQALEYHEKDLKIANTHNLDEAKSRALDNLGRTYTRRGQYDKAIEITKRPRKARPKSCFEQKSGSVQNPVEATWLYHEMGRCYLETGNYSKARECGHKSLQNASFDRAWQLNAGMLLAQAEANLGDYEASLDSLEKALCIAEEDYDLEAVQAITKAIGDIKLKMPEDGNQETTSMKGKSRKKKQEKSQPSSPASRRSSRRKSHSAASTSSVRSRRSNTSVKST